MREVFLIIIVFFSLTGQVLSQQYLKIPIDTNYFWKQVSVTTPSISNCNYNYQIRYKKDTIVNSKTYNKYSTFGVATGNSVSPCNPNFIRHGYLRQDTLAKKVFILDNNFIEQPLYNFSKMIGDTMQIYQFNLSANITVTITMLDSTMFGDGKYHRRQWAINSTYGNSIYEGMGCVTGGLYAHNSAGYIPNTEGFICFGKTTPFSPYFGGSSSNCYLSSVGLNENISMGNDMFKIYPNPTNDILNIDVDILNGNSSKLQILNSLGQILSEEKIKDPKSQINLSHFPSGIYYLKMQGINGQKVIKIIKE